MASDDADPLLEATTALLPPLLAALDALARAGRLLHPPHIDALAGGLTPFREPLSRGVDAFAAVSWPAHLDDFASAARTAADQALAALDGFAGAGATANPAIAAYRALGRQTAALEALYPVAAMLPPVSRFFLNEPQRDDEALQARLLAADPGRPDIGVLHADNGLDERGGVSLYVPESYDAAEPLPLVVALHGGSGHGRRFLWSWLRDARSLGAIVLAPTSRDDTWSLMGPDRDSARLAAMVERACEQWAVDRRRILLTGMSDGGTFSYLAGLQDDAPYTHLAPISAAFHPMLLEAASAGRVRGLPVYLAHGALDWMFPADMARMARDALTAAGADVTYREIDDLSHTYPREENARILEWLAK
ncbi:MAG: phospholipase [bacterium]